MFRWGQRCQGGAGQGLVSPQPRAVWGRGDEGCQDRRLASLQVDSSTKQRLRPKPGPELPPFPVARFPFLREPKDLSSQLETIVPAPQNPRIWRPKEITDSPART